MENNTSNELGNYNPNEVAYLIMENDPDMSGIPSELRYILAKRFLNRTYWFKCGEDFKADPVGSLERILTTLKDGDGIVGQTNYHDEDQVERMILFMFNAKNAGRRLNFYTVLKEEVYGTLEDAFLKFLETPLAYKTPPNYSATPEVWKRKLDQMLFEVLDYHAVYRVRNSSYRQDKRVTGETILALRVSRKLQAA